MLGERRMRWADVVQMLYKCFVFAGELVAPWGFALERMSLTKFTRYCTVFKLVIKTFWSTFQPKKLTVTEID